MRFICGIVYMTATLHWFISPASAQIDEEDQPEDPANATYHMKLNTLQKNLLKNYSKEVVPGKNVEMQVLQAMLDHVDEVNEMEQTISAQGFFQLQWTDPRLNWENRQTASHGDAIYLPSWKIWFPVFYLLNSAVGATYKYSISWWSRCRIKSNGEVLLKPRFSLKATCIFDYTDFPFDEQQCPFSIGSWDYTSNDIDFKLYSQRPTKAAVWGSKSEEYHISNWKVVDVWHNVTYLTHWYEDGKYKAKIIDFPVKNEPSWPRYNLWFKLRRNDPFFGLSLVLPAVMTSLFTIAVFWTVRLDFGVYICLINILIQGICSRDLLLQLPPSIGGTPRIVTYYGLNLSLTAFAIVLILLLKGISSWNIQAPSPIRNFNEIVGNLRILPPIRPSELRNARSTSAAEDSPAENQEVIDKEETSPKLPYAVSGEDWTVFSNALRLIFFFLYSVIYLVGMFRWLH